MKTKKIDCCEPVFIVNPYLQTLILTNGNYTLFNQRYDLTRTLLSEYSYNFPMNIFYPKKNGITVDNMDSCYITDNTTGEIYPMYMQVPCGKCLICCAKKSNEWMFRAACENKYSTSTPIFITLTYNDSHLPTDGVQKRDLQLFMKRLRINLTRKGFFSSLRYLGCGEYGSSSARPHYHLILWNFPLLQNITEVFNVINTAWKLGFVYCRYCDYGAVSYVTKYMRKPQSVPKGSNDTFFLSSRKNGGIGAMYANEMAAYYRANPDQLEISVYDPYSNKTFTSFIPSYFRLKFFPPLSSLVPKYIRDTFKQYCHLSNMIWYIFQCKKECEFDFDNELLHNESIGYRYSFLPKNISEFVPRSVENRLLKLSDEALNIELQSYFIKIRNAYTLLFMYDVDATIVEQMEYLKDKRKIQLQNYFRDAPEVDTVEKADLIRKRNYEDIRKEKI